MMITCSLQLDLILHECSQILTGVLKPWTGAFSNTNVLWHRDTPVYRSARFPMVSGHSAGRVALWGCQVTSASWGTLNTPLFHHTRTHKWNTRNKQLFRHAIYMFYITWMFHRFFPPKQFTWGMPLTVQQSVNIITHIGLCFMYLIEFVL